MKNLLLAAAAIVAGVAAWPQAQSLKVQPAAAEVAPAPLERVSVPAAGDLDARFFAREREMRIEDLFAVPTAPVQAPAVPPAPTAAPPAAAPGVPPLPFSYLGRMTKRGKVTVYLLRNQEMVLAEQGSTLDGTYTVERISPTGVEFLYVPLQARQTLGIPQAP